MESSTSKVDMMKSLLFKAGIPVALSAAAAFLFSRLVARRVVPKEDDIIPETPVDSTGPDSQFGSEESFYSPRSSSPSAEYEEPLVVDSNWEEEILGQKLRIEDLQKRESELEMRFMRYNELKEKESLFLQLRNMIILEKAHIDFLDREISVMEDESRSLEKFFELYLRLLEQLEYWKSKNGLLQRKVKNLLRRKRVHSNLIQEKDVKIRAREAELSRTRESLETSTNVVEKLEDEIRELRMVLDQTQEEKNEEKSASSLSKIDDEAITMGEENSPPNEVEQQKKCQEWNNSYLRHELSTKNQENEDHNQKKGDWEMDFELENHGLKEEFEGTASEKNENVYGIMDSDQTCSKRKKLLTRLRKWVVEGCEKGKGKVEETERHEVLKCFGRHFVSDEADLEHLQARRSRSSV